ncbi:MAG: hypothetical protein E5Y02_22375 [Mesorhizobium sp.]|nr:MAG: hypothetical protein E5Y12_07655 [Mesorhizobium sp.]TJV40305.1 MAG: hypothetical protein E5Y02_22375 [Mesorhizobium sp.]TPN50865.1 hypothetical protein FJ976_14665 [Mesorhizobium sp. B1-1-9]TPN53100.1 hypothetical protein FJ978_09905 [Mesorhizobium sp. B1-1-7]
MHVAQEWSPKSGNRFWDNGMHQTIELMRFVAR